MFKTKAQKLMGVIIGLLGLTLIIISYQYHLGVKEDERHWKTFVNHFYFSIDSSLNRIDYLIENQRENKRLEEDIRELEKELLNANRIVRSGSSFMNNELYSTSFFLDATYFLYGITMTGSVSAELPPMGNDNHLREEDLALLKTIRGYLVEAKEELYSEQTRQENPNLTIDELNDIITTHLNHSIMQIYKDAFE